MLIDGSSVYSQKVVALGNIGRALKHFGSGLCDVINTRVSNRHKKIPGGWEIAWEDFGVVDKRLTASLPLGVIVGGQFARGC
ncbi:hypothetical protein WAI453_012493 [Rhynchosporium graminicola]